MDAIRNDETETELIMYSVKAEMKENTAGLLEHPQREQFLHYTLLFLLLLLGVRLSPLGTAATTGLVYQSQMIDDVDCGAVGGMRIGRGNRSTRRKPVPVPLCPPQIPHDLTWARTGLPQWEASD
jgi:hypothetical protein